MNVRLLWTVLEMVSRKLLGERPSKIYLPNDSCFMCVTLLLMERNMGVPAVTNLGLKMVVLVVPRKRTSGIYL